MKGQKLIEPFKFNYGSSPEGEVFLVDTEKVIWQHNVFWQHNYVIISGLFSTRLHQAVLLSSIKDI